MDHKAFSDQHLLEVTFVPPGRQPFVLDTSLPCALVLQQAQRSETKDAVIRIRFALKDAAPVFLRRDIALPVQMVLDTSGAGHRLRETARGEVDLEDFGADLTALPPSRCVWRTAIPIAFKSAHRARSGRSTGVGQTW